MNVNQRRVLIAAAAFVVAMLLYPPFNVAAGGAPRSLARLVYQWLFAPPAGGHVDVGLLLAQWIAVGIVAGTAYVLLGNRK